MTTPIIKLDSNARAIFAQVEAFPARMAEAVRAGLDRENELSVGWIVRTKLSRRGRDTLGVVTNRLRLSLRPAKAQITADGVVSSIGSNVRYAGWHEFGAAGTTQQVRAFTRRQRQNNVTTTTRGGKTKLLASGIARVKPHARKIRYTGRRMIGRGLEERTASYSTTLSRAIVAAWEAGGGDTGAARGSVTP